MAMTQGETFNWLLEEKKRLEAENARLREALQGLLDACEEANSHEELSEMVDGSLLDAANAVLRQGREGKCANCGETGPHFVPPSLGEEGFYACKKREVSR